MSRLCLLIMKPPCSEDDVSRMCGLLSRAIEGGSTVAVYLLGDGVYCAKKGRKDLLGNSLRRALSLGAQVSANKKDLLARGMPMEQVEPRINVLEDFQKTFIEDIMEKSERVVSW